MRNGESVVWRAWGAGAPDRLLEMFLTGVDHDREQVVTTRFPRKFVVEVKPLSSDLELETLDEE